MHSLGRITHMQQPQCTGQAGGGETFLGLPFNGERGDHQDGLSKHIRGRKKVSLRQIERFGQLTDDFEIGLGQASLVAADPGSRRVRLTVSS